MSVIQSLTVTEVSGSVNALDNTSQVRILWKSQQTGESWNGYEKAAYYYVSINGGSETKYKVIYTLPQNSVVTLKDITITVKHKADGSSTVKVRTWMDTGISAGVVEQSETIDLTTIARASTITSVSNTTLGSDCSVKWTPQSTQYQYRVSFSLGEWSDGVSVRPSTTSEYTLKYTPPLDVAEQLPNAKTGTMKVTLETYPLGNTLTPIGSPSSKEFTVTVPDNASTQPTVSMSLSPSSTLSSPYNNLYIQGYSKVKASLGFDAKYGASIVASSITLNGITYASPYESGILSQTGKVTIKATVKDSRGYYGTNYKDIEVIPYSKPYIRAISGKSSVIVARCDGNADFTESGTYLKIEAKIVYSKVASNETQYNYGFIKFRYRKEGDSSYSDWQTILDCKAHNSDEVSTEPLLNGTLDVKFNYQVQVIATDDFNESVPITFAIPSDAVYMDRPDGGKSMGLGGYSSGDDKLDVYWKTMARGGLSLFDAKGDEIPLGSTMPLPRDQLKDTWDANNLECGIYVVQDKSPLKSGETVIMYNGVLIQMQGTIGDSVKFQLALPVDGNRSPMYRVKWYSIWDDWRSFYTLK